MSTRVESDTMGQIEVPNDKYYGAQTARSLMNFDIGGEKMPTEIITAFGILKKAAALANHKLGLMDEKTRDLVVAAADEVISGKLADHFPLVVWQTGSGTQSNMNVNEVISNRAIEMAGGVMGSKKPVHPNDHVNMSQSSNDTYPTAMHIAAVEAVEGYLYERVELLRNTLNAKSEAFMDVVKIGRTHLQDATPLTLGQEISGWVAQIDYAMAAIKATMPQLKELALGGTAVGTGLNAHPDYAVAVAKEIAALTGRDFVTGPNKFALLAGHDAFVGTSGALKQLAVAFMKIANDVRWLASGPRSGLGEITIPENEPGSSIMPGKVNPVIPEVVNQVCFDVIGGDVTVTMAAEGGQLQLNVFEPIIAYRLLRGMIILTRACEVLRTRCVEGITANVDRMRWFVEHSIGIVTALVPILGYEKATEIAKEALESGSGVYDLVCGRGLMTRAELDRALNPEMMTAPRPNSHTA
jgi:fumarate hydratase class II